MSNTRSIRPRDALGVTAKHCVVIPVEQLEEATLRRVIEDYVLREGTDYGAREYSLEEKVEQVLALLRRQEARLVFDATTRTTTVLDLP